MERPYHGMLEEHLAERFEGETQSYRKLVDLMSTIINGREILSKHALAAELRPSIFEYEKFTKEISADVPDQKLDNTVSSFFESQCFMRVDDGFRWPQKDFGSLIAPGTGHYVKDGHKLRVLVSESSYSLGEMPRKFTVSVGDRDRYIRILHGEEDEGERK